MQYPFSAKPFIIITLLTSLWVHASEVFRYFVFVMPDMRESLTGVPNVAPMDFGVFMIWGIWDTLLTGLYVFVFWLCANAYGNSRKAILVSALVSWCFFFVLFWVGMANMNLTDWGYIILPLPLALIETLVASWIISSLYRWQEGSA